MKETFERRLRHSTLYLLAILSIPMNFGLGGDKVELLPLKEVLPLDRLLSSATKIDALAEKNRPQPAPHAELDTLSDSKQKTIDVPFPASDFVSVSAHLKLKQHDAPSLTRLLLHTSESHSVQLELAAEKMAGSWQLKVLLFDNDRSSENKQNGQQIGSCEWDVSATEQVFDMHVYHSLLTVVVNKEVILYVNVFPDSRGFTRFEIQYPNDHVAIENLGVRHVTCPVGSAPAEVKALIKKGARLVAVRDFDAAIVSLNRAIQLISDGNEELSCHLPYAYQQLALATTLSRGSRIGLSIARKGAKAAETHLTRLHTPYARCQLMTGTALRRNGQPKEALKLYENVLSSLKMTDDAVGIAEAYPTVATALRHAGRTAEARALLEECIPKTERLLKTQPELINAWMVAQINLAVIDINSCRWEQAATRLEDALSCDLIASVSPEALHGARVNLATVLQDLGHLDRAQVILQKILSEQQLPDGSFVPDAFATLSGLGGIRQEQGELLIARNLYLDAMRVLVDSRGKDSAYRALIFTRMAELYNQMDQPENAYRSLADAEQLLKSTVGTKHMQYAQVLVTRAEFLLSNGEAQKAKSCLDQALSISRETGFDEYGWGGRLHLKMGSVQMALRNLEEALKEFELAHGLFQSRYGNISEQTLRGQLGVTWTKCLMGRKDEVRVDLEKLSSDVSDLIKSRMLSLPAARRLMWVRQYNMFELLPSMACAFADDPELSYRIVSNIKRSAARIRAQSSTDRDDPRLIELKGRLRSLLTSRTLAGDGHRRDAALNALTGEIIQRNEELARATKNAYMPDGESVRVNSRRLLEAVNPSRAIVDFSIAALPPDSGDGVPLKALGDKQSRVWRYVAFVLLPQKNGPCRVVMQRLSPFHETNAVINRFRGSFAAKDGAWLHEHLWKPIQALLDNRKRIIVIPAEQIAQVPWSALPGHREGSFLIEDGYAFSRVGFAQQLSSAVLSKRSNGSPARHFTFIGGVDYGDVNQAELRSATLPAQFADSVLRAGWFRNWSPLPASLREVKDLSALAKTIPHVKQTVLSANEATETRFREIAPRSTHLHVATHAFYAPPNRSESVPDDGRSGQIFGGTIPADSPQSTLAARIPLLLSGVVFAGANLQSSATGQPNDDGILLADEITGLDLSQTETVVLSACDSGTGAVIPGDVVQGLTDAFHQAGVRNVISSLWEVSDSISEVLMVELYKQHLSEGVDFDIALARAQLMVMRMPSQSKNQSRGSRPSEKQRPSTNGQIKSRRHPRFWAGFQVSGPGS